MVLILEKRTRIELTSLLGEAVGSTLGKILVAPREGLIVIPAFVLEHGKRLLQFLDLLEGLQAPFLHQLPTLCIACAALGRELHELSDVSYFQAGALQAFDDA